MFAEVQEQMHDVAAEVDQGIKCLGLGTTSHYAPRRTCLM